jgi:hypothetical protein
MGIARNLARLVPNGSGVLSDANAPSGSVIQVVQTFDTFQASTSSTTFGDLTSVTITPSSSSNKVLVRFLAHLEMSSSAIGRIRLQRNGTNIGLGSGGVASKIILSQGYGGINGSNLCYEFLDSPATTSAITYKIQWSVSGSTFYYNQGVSYTNSDGYDASTLTAMEIAG